MRLASAQSSSFSQGPSLRQRVIAGAIALAVNVLLLIMLLSLASSPPRPPDKPPSAFDFSLTPERGLTAPRPKAAAKAHRAAAAPQPVQPKVAPPPIVKATPAHVPWQVLTVTKEEFAASDISRLPKGAPVQSAGTNGESAAADGGASGTGEGSGPGGERLYPADWYRRPTQAELATYLPHNLPEGSWGEIACRTIERYHVEDCRELDDSPAGSGLSRAVREAAWQFLVMPPRVGGHPTIGAWVRIRITMKMLGEK